jgi:tetratricopeptide (TPR) repeat protein
MKDIEYFSESQMSAINVKEFRENLPEKLRQLFDIPYKKVNVRLVDSRYAILQGYRGPSWLCSHSIGDSGVIAAESGVQEIKFWHGVSKHFNWYPVVGSFGIAIDRLSRYTNWFSVFFNESSGEMLSEQEVSRTRNDNKLACDCVERGDQLFLKRKYDEAVESYEKAIELCSIESERKNFKLKLENVNDAWAEVFYSKGLELLSEKNLTFAVFNFKTGHEKCSVLERQRKFEGKIVQAAKSLWDEAWKMEMTDKSDATNAFRESFESFNEASKLDQKNHEYSKLMEISKLKVDGNELIKQGSNLVMQEYLAVKLEAFSKFRQAKEKFSKGLELSNNSQFQSSIDLAEIYMKEVDEIVRKLTQDFEKQN